MAGDEPFGGDSLYGTTISDMVLLRDSRAMRKLRGIASMCVDLKVCELALADLLQVTEEVLRSQRKATAAEFRQANEKWIVAVISYGRCFVDSRGRKPLLEIDIGTMGGDLALHQHFMEARHSTVAHATVVDRRVEVFAKLRPLSSEPGVVGLAFIESYIPLPGAEVLRQHLNHVVALGHSTVKQLNDLKVRLSSYLTENHSTELYKCLEANLPWSEHRD